MEIKKFGDAPFYSAKDHDDVTARRLQGGEATTADFVTVGHSTFPDGAVVPMGSGPTGKVYVVTEGVLTIEQENGIRHDLHKGDSIFIEAGEARGIRNTSGQSATMIVITPSITR